MEKLIAFDIETTGLYPERGDRILEIGAVSIVDNLVASESGFEMLIHPGMHIPPEISKINGITDDMVEDAPPLENVLPRFLEYIGELPLIAHNASFDVGFVSHYIDELNLSPLKNPIIDTLELSRRVFSQAETHNLDALLKRLNIHYSRKQRHRSIGDAYLTALAYLKLRDIPLSSH
jgi:DNA polymerase III epsilon subunit